MRASSIVARIGIAGVRVGSNDDAGIEALQRSALTSALPRAESSDARGDRVPAESGDEVTEPLLLFIPATAPPANTLVVESTLSSERRPSTRPSDVAGEGRAFSVVVSHSATSASVPMEKSLIEGEAGNDEPDLGVDVADDAKPVAAFAVSLLPPPSAVADERCDSRRMSEDIVL